MVGEQHVNLLPAQRHEYGDHTRSRAGGVPESSEHGGAECVCSCDHAEVRGSGAQRGDQGPEGIIQCVGQQRQRHLKTRMLMQV